MGGGAVCRGLEAASDGDMTDEETDDPKGQLSRRWFNDLDRYDLCIPVIDKSRSLKPPSAA